MTALREPRAGALDGAVFHFAVNGADFLERFELQHGGLIRRALELLWLHPAGYCPTRGPRESPPMIAPIFHPGEIRRTFATSFDRRQPALYKAFFYLIMSPVIVTGMHRSGTSAVARLVRQLGINVGSNLLGRG